VPLLTDVLTGTEMKSFERMTKAELISAIESLQAEKRNGSAASSSEKCEELLLQ